MRILIYGINFSPELTGIGKYSGEMASWLEDQGNDVLVITAPPYYPEWQIKEGHSNFYSFKKFNNITIIRCPLFVPKKLSTVSRLLHLISFSLSSFIPIIGTIFWKPDIVMQVAPTLMCSMQTLLLSKFSNAKSILHIQDFEVDAMFSISMEQTSRFKRAAISIEKNILNSFDIISTISQGMVNKVKEKGIDFEKIVFFPNWSEIDRFLNQSKDEIYLQSLGIDPLKNIILYSGNMGEKQGLEIVIHAANKMKESKNSHFVLVGDGAIKEKLQDLSNKLGLLNVTFLPLQPYKDLPVLLGSADCHLVVQKKGAADLVFPSKLTNILAVGGNAVITASEATSLGDLCNQFPGIAVLSSPESVSGLVVSIEKSLSMPKPNLIAKNYAKKFLDKEIILNKFFGDLI